MSDLQPDAPNEYTVVKGDTLWGIAGRFLKDPWKWPQVWEMNRDQVKDPHWIYPGNVIRLDRSGDSPRLNMGGGGAGGADGSPGGPSGGTEAQAQANVIVLEPRVRVENLQTAIPTIPGSVIGPFLNQPLVVEAGGLDNSPTIVATEESRVIVGQGDTAYADRIGTDSAVNWQVFRQGSALRDPETGEVLGIEARYVGDARVRRFGNPTTLEITKARQEINRGDRLTPARETTFPSYVPRAPEKFIRAMIMSVEEGVSELGQFQVITINRGSREGLEIGHVLASYRRGAFVTASGQMRSEGPTVASVGSWFSSLKWWNNAETKPVSPVPDTSRPADNRDTSQAGATLAGSSLRLPDERTGLVIVFRVFQKMSYGLVVKATKPIYVGDVLQTP
ncbi:MAG TPA: LysM peptidoglycan-binding domain-containing protein [Usitatibacter sp.]|nr:LysM peptidoglycan-binding domain-containing protein [Usitatibacter sp.]